MVWMFGHASAFDQDLGWCVDDGVDLGAAFDDTPCESTSCGVEVKTLMASARRQIPRRARHRGRFRSRRRARRFQVQRHGHHARRRGRPHAQQAPDAATVVDADAAADARAQRAPDAAPSSTPTPRAPGPASLDAPTDADADAAADARAQQAPDATADAGTHAEAVAAAPRMPTFGPLPATPASPHSTLVPGNRAPVRADA